MPSIKDERLKLWSLVGDAMANGDGAAAKLRMDVFCANFQDIPKAVKEYNAFKAKIDKSYRQQTTGIVKGARALGNPILRNRAEASDFSDLEWWRIRELYYFLYRLGMKYNMFPIGIVDLRPRGREPFRGPGA